MKLAPLPYILNIKQPPLTLHIRRRSNNILHNLLQRSTVQIQLRTATLSCGEHKRYHVYQRCLCDALCTVSNVVWEVSALYRKTRGVAAPEIDFQLVAGFI